MHPLWISRDLTEDVEAFKEMGIEVYNLPVDEREKWKAAVKPYVDEKLSAMGDFGKKFMAIADKANKANP